MAGKNKSAESLPVAIACQRIADGKRIAQALAHLDAVQRQRAGEHPVTGKRLAIGRFALGDFTFIVRENVVDAAAVNIECMAQIFAGHRRTFDMPAGKAFAPRAGPAQNMLRVGFFP